jgi:hypothetical protein
MVEFKTKEAMGPKQNIEENMDDLSSFKRNPPANKNKTNSKFPTHYIPKTKTGLLLVHCQFSQTIHINIKKR